MNTNVHQTSSGFGIKSGIEIGYPKEMIQFRIDFTLTLTDGKS